MKNIFTLLLAAVVAIAADAAAISPNKATPVALDRSEVLAKAKKHAKKGNAAKRHAPRKAKKVVASTTVIDTDFSFLSEGTLENPVPVETDDYYCIPEDITGEANYGWGGEDIYSAGGYAYLPFDYDEQVQGYLYSPDFYEAGILTITFEAAADVPEGEVDVYIGLWDFENEMFVYDDFVEVALDDQLQTRTVTYDASELAAFIPLYVEFDPWGSNVYIKSVKVEVEGAALEAPVVDAYTDFTGTGFDIAWTAVDGADHYEVFVAEVDCYGNITDNFAVDGQTVEATEYTVTGITPGIVYAYWVIAVDANGEKSFKSNVEVVSALLPVTGFSGAVRDDLSGYDASWTATPGANLYVIESTLYHPATAAGTITIADADFSDVVSTGELGAPEEGEDMYAEFDELPGWTFWLNATIPGAVGFQGEEFYASMGYIAQIESGVYDLSAVKDGAVTVKVNAVSGTGSTLVFGLFNYNAETESYAPVDIVYADAPMTEEFADFSATLKGGSDNSIILIAVDDRNGNAFFRTITLTADIAAGQAVGVPCPTAAAFDGETSAAIDVPCQPGDYFRASITPYTLDDEGYVYIQGPASGPFFVEPASAISEISAADAPIRYYNLQGIEVANPARGIVIRRQGSSATTILLN